MNSLQDWISYLDENHAFTDSTRTKLTSGIPRFIRNRKEVLNELQNFVNNKSENISELIYNLLHPNDLRVCQVCGKPVKFYNFEYGYRHSCCKKCGDILTTQIGKATKQEKYGDIHYNNSQKTIKTKIERYGTVFVNHEKTKQTKLERYGNCYYNNPQKSAKTKEEKYGDKNYNNENRRLLTNLKKYGTMYPSQLEEVKLKQRQNSHKKYLYNGIGFDSSWELAFYIKSIDEGKNILREPKVFTYISNNEKYLYTPDFEINGIFYEIKGTHLIKQGIWQPPKEEVKYLPEDKQKLIYQKYQDKQKCAVENNVEIIDYSRIKPYLNYCISKYRAYNWQEQFKESYSNMSTFNFFLKNRDIPYLLTENDLSLKPEAFFTKVLPTYDADIQKFVNSLPQEFPYPEYPNKRLLEDYNHLCTYEYKPNQKLGIYILNQFHKSIWKAHREKLPSPFEAWQDRDLLEKCVRNRFIYCKNLTPHNILTGFSVTKMAPRVSLFHPALGRHLIQKYLNDYQTIFDPFSGFSGRLLGTCSLGKTYIGQDINIDHVKESNQIVDFLQLKNVKVTQQDILADAKKTYDCLFTCPPYGGKEHWNILNDTVEKSCDEWIDVCLSKYKCDKYLFVVDTTEKYKDNIVEIIENKSHLTNSREYVILL